MGLFFFHSTVKDTHKTSTESLAIVQLNTSLLHWLSEQQYERIRSKPVRCINDFTLTWGYHVTQSLNTCSRYNQWQILVICSRTSLHNHNFNRRYRYRYQKKSMKIQLKKDQPYSPVFLLYSGISQLLTVKFIQPKTQRTTPYQTAVFGTVRASQHLTYTSHCCGRPVILIHPILCSVQN
jgi:hypothetical protein